MNLSIESLAFIQAVQTIGIFVLAGVVIYVVARLDRAFEKGSKRLQMVLKSQQEFESRQAALIQRVEATEARLLHRIELLEKRPSQ
jgi:hypothetical protein